MYCISMLQAWFKPKIWGYLLKKVETVHFAFSLGRSKYADIHTKNGRFFEEGSCVELNCPDHHWCWCGGFIQNSVLWRKHNRKWSAPNFVKAGLPKCSQASPSLPKATLSRAQPAMITPPARRGLRHLGLLSKKPLICFEALQFRSFWSKNAGKEAETQQVP